MSPLNSKRMTAPVRERFVKVPRKTVETIRQRFTPSCAQCEHVGCRLERELRALLERGGR